MQCPLCGVDLLMSERQGIEIDYCPKCRGVWLDRGELDKIIERSTAEMLTRSQPATGIQSAATSPSYRQPASASPERRAPAPCKEQHRYQDSEAYPYRGKKKKKRGSFLEDLFDFDD